jgi:amidohydrolase
VVNAELGWLDAWLSDHTADIVGVRRHIHAHPELGRVEYATTELIETQLVAAGLEPKRLPAGTGLVCDVGAGEPVIALRADLDALPLDDAKDVPYRSTVPGVCHACGHDVHTSIVLGAGLALAAAPALPSAVRLVFQPAEEMLPGGALDVLDSGVLDNIGSIIALHCDPRLDAGRVGIRVGTITAASDSLEVRLEGPGGHTARPHLTVDLVEALARVVVGVPAEVARRLDPHVPFSVVWGAVGAGTASNVIPSTGWLRGSVRTLDFAAWERAEQIVTDAVHAAVHDTGATVHVDYRRGVPPVVNDADVVDRVRRGVGIAVDDGAVVSTEPSMGGEDFGWYLQSIPGALARLGVRRPGSAGGDLHQATFDIDESAIAVGIRTLVGTVLADT